MLQDSMDAVRRDFFALGLIFRPRLFWPPPARAQEPACDMETMSESSSPGADYSATETLYLRIAGTAKGVLQVHRAHGLH